MSILNGGSAFPQPTNNLSGQGMSLRDWFAGQAMAALVVATMRQQFDSENVAAANVRAWPSTAYDIADAMLAERNKETEG